MSWSSRGCVLAAASFLGCAPTVESTSGHVVPNEHGTEATFVEAVKESARHDLACTTGPIAVGNLSSGNSNGLCYADGCGRRATYGFEGGGRAYRLLLVSTVDLTRPQ